MREKVPETGLLLGMIQEKEKDQQELESQALSGNSEDIQNAETKANSILGPSSNAEIGNGGKTSTDGTLQIQNKNEAVPPVSSESFVAKLKNLAVTNSPKKFIDALSRIAFRISHY